MTIKTKDLVKTVDTKAIKDKADCFQRGDDWYEAEPKWDRIEWSPSEFGKIVFLKELEVTEDGEPVGYVRSDLAVYDDLREDVVRYSELARTRVPKGLHWFLVILSGLAGVHMGALAMNNLLTTVI